MKHVFSTTAETAHAWASQTQPDGRSNAGSVHFRDTAFYSYSTPIANIHTNNGERLVLFSSRSYSVTTNGKHVPAARRATLGTPTCNVARVAPDCADDHARNMVDMVERRDAVLLRMKRARKDWSRGCAQDQADRITREMLAYAEFFALPHDFDVATLRAEMDARRAERMAEQEREQAEYAAAEKLALAEAIPAWLAGGRASSAMRYATETLLRVTGDNVETSRGAFVPIAAARALWTAWRNGTLKTGERVGMYAYRESTPDEIVIGCHTITRTVADAFAAAQGWNK